MNAPLFISPDRILEPGLNVLPPGIERYLVRGGGSLAITLNPGDEIEITSPEGLQPGEIIVFNQQGKSDMQTLGATANGRAEGFKQILANQSRNTEKLHASAKLMPNFSSAA